jgi:hypothetical protein
MNKSKCNCQYEKGNGHSFECPMYVEPKYPDLTPVSEVTCGVCRDCGFCLNHPAPQESDWEKEFAELYEKSFDWNGERNEYEYNQMMNFLRHQKELSTKEERTKLLNIIENGGTSDTVSTYEYLGEKYINQRQLLKALNNLTS